MVANTSSGHNEISFSTKYLLVSSPQFEIQVRPWLMILSYQSFSPHTITWFYVHLFYKNGDENSYSFILFGVIGGMK